MAGNVQKYQHLVFTEIKFIKLYKMRFPCLSSLGINTAPTHTVLFLALATLGVRRRGEI